MPILRPHASRFHERCISSAEFDPRAHWTIKRTSLWSQSGLQAILGFWGATFPKMGDSLPSVPTNRRAKFDAPIALSSAEKSATVQTHKITNKYVCLWGRPYIHTCRGQILPIDASPLHCRRARSQKGTGVYRQYLPPRADSSDFGLLGEQSSPKWEISCPERPWTIVPKIWRR